MMLSKKGNLMILRNGVRDVLLAAVLFGLSAPIAKILVGDLSPQLLAGVLYLGSGIGLTIVTLARSRTLRSYAALHSSDIPFLIGAPSRFRQRCACFCLTCRRSSGGGQTGVLLNP